MSAEVGLTHAYDIFRDILSNGESLYHHMRAGLCDMGTNVSLLLGFLPFANNEST